MGLTKLFTGNVQNVNTEQMVSGKLWCIIEHTAKQVVLNVVTIGTKPNKVYHRDTKAYTVI